MQILIDQLRTMALAAIAALPQVLIAITVLLITWLIAKGLKSFVRRVISRWRLRPSLKTLTVQMIAAGIWIAGLIVAAVIAFPNLTPTKILAGLGLGSVAIGFAFKDVFENFLAGIIILLRREMRIGDFIECEGLEGRVESIAVRETHIRQTDGQLVIVPNSLLFKNPLTIRTDQAKRRITIICGVAYSEDVDQCRTVIQQAVSGCSTVADDQPVEIFADAFADSSINFAVTWWTGSQPLDIRRSKDEVVTRIKMELDRAGIEIPFPYRTLTFKQPLEMKTVNSSVAEPRDN